MSHDEKIEFAVVNQLELNKIRNFKESVKEIYGKYGQFRYTFYPGGIGCRVDITSELSGETVDVTNYAIW